MAASTKNLAQNRARAVLLGVAAAILMMYALPRYALAGGTFSLPRAALICAASYLVCGIVAGLAWGDEAWGWGSWLAGPFWLLEFLGLLFAGYLNKFLTNDVPLLIISAVAAFLGGYIGARLLTRHNHTGPG